ncbi:hypothetical protein KCP73_20365 [Salmonella enterica subsp. enterica]|nr:hypothetical protein KCP73_20365 [Salmonella enterica subsp. enterica]
MRAGCLNWFGDRRQYHLHGAEWASDDAVAADALLRIDLRCRCMRDRAVRTGAGRIFAMVTCDRALRWVRCLMTVIRG